MAKRGRPPKNPLAQTTVPEVSTPPGDSVEQVGNMSSVGETGQKAPEPPTTDQKPKKKKLSKAQKGAIQKMLAARQKSIKAEKKAANAKVKAKKEKSGNSPKVGKGMGRKFL